MFTADHPIVVDRQFAVIASQYTLDIRDLYLDEYAIRINYKVTPPVPRHQNPEIADALFFSWGGYAVDNLDNHYNSYGGACGLSTDGKFTEGVLSFIPAMKEDVVFLEFFTPLLKDIFFLDVTFIPEMINITDEYTFRILLQ
jgi:hypothetical protein